MPGAQLPLLVQQPAQVLLSQRHTPPMQASPEPQALPLPQPQVPFDRQPSVLSGSQALQVPPLVPQLGQAVVSHTPKRQQPVGQLVDEHATTHMPPSHMPLPHETQVAAPAPQRWAVSPG